MYRILLIEIRLGSHNSPKYSLRNSFFQTGPEIVDSNEFEDSTFLSSPGFTSRRVKNWNPPRRLVHASIQRRKKGERNCTPSVERRMGSAWIVNTADLSETSRPPSTTKTFPKGPIRSSLSCAADVSARIGEEVSGRSVRDRVGWRIIFL